MKEFQVKKNSEKIQKLLILKSYEKLLIMWKLIVSLKILLKILKKLKSFQIPDTALVGVDDDGTKLFNKYKLIHLNILFYQEKGMTLQKYL